MDSNHLSVDTTQSALQIEHSASQQQSDAQMLLSGSSTPTGKPVDGNEPPEDSDLQNDKQPRVRIRLQLPHSRQDPMEASNEMKRDGDTLDGMSENGAARVSSPKNEFTQANYSLVSQHPQADGSAHESPHLENSSTDVSRKRKKSEGDSDKEEATQSTSSKNPSPPKRRERVSEVTLITSRDFAPLPPDPPVKPAKEEGSKRMERKSKTEAISNMNGKGTPGDAVDPPQPLHHPTRKPPPAHVPIHPLPFFSPNSHKTEGESTSTSTIPTVHNTPRYPPPRTRSRMFDVEEAPTFYPTREQFADPLKYIQWVGEPSGGKGKQYGIVKIVPPDGWNPEFVLNQDTFRFRTRVQRLNSLSADARASLNYQEQLQKFHAQQGYARVSIPIVGGRPLDLYHLKLIVSNFGGYEIVTRNKTWPDITAQLGHDEKDAAILATQIKRAYTKIIHPFEQFLAVNRDAAKKSSNASSSHADAERAASLGAASGHTDDDMMVDSNSQNGDSFPEGSEEAKKRRRSRRRNDSKGLPTTLTSLRKRKASPGADGHASGGYRVAPGAEGEMCEICLRGEDGVSMLLCDECNRGYHMYCLDPPLTSVPRSEWYCPPCLVGTGNDYGFDDGETHSLWSFWQRADAFRTAWWQARQDKIWSAPDGQPNGVTRPVGNADFSISEDDVEREFWRLVHSPDETVEVEYGADVHSTTHGSALPTLETHPLSAYARDGWNLNNLPILNGSLLRYIKSDISGMTVPWIYIGMIFSTFCWHNEDHYTYSINFQHFGDTKTWYGVPGEDADKLDDALKKAAPDLFEHNPDLLFQLVTMMSPDKLRKEGVRVYACDQRANEFVITYPKAYHSGFNHGFNLNEAVNFALPDWMDDGLKCVRRYQQYERIPVFSHDELVCTVYQHNQSIETASWLQTSMQEMVDREIEKRNLLRKLVPGIQETVVSADLPEPEYQCAYCNIFCYLGQIISEKAEGVACLDHGHQVCGIDSPSKWTLRLRFSDEHLEMMLQKTSERAAIPSNWQARLHKVIASSSRPSLRSLRGLLNEGERITIPMPEMDQLRVFVDKANRWVDEANTFIAKRHQKRLGVASKDIAGKRVKRGSKGADEDEAMHISEEATQDLGEQDRVYTLLDEAELMPFDAPEILALKNVADSMEKFKHRSRVMLEYIDSGFEPSRTECEELLALGSSLSVKLDEVDELQKYVGRLAWLDRMDDIRESFTFLQDVQDYLKEGRSLGVPPSNEYIHMLNDRLNAGLRWKQQAEAILKDGPSGKRGPHYTTSQISEIQRYGNYSSGNCRWHQKDVEELMKDSVNVAVDRDVHLSLAHLSKEVKDYSRQAITLLRSELLSTSGEPPVMQRVEDVEYLLSNLSSVHVIVDGETELVQKMNQQSVWEEHINSVMNVMDVINPGKLPMLNIQAPVQEVLQWVKERCLRISESLEPDDEAPGSALHYCVCRKVNHTADAEEMTCIRCECVYHAQCLNLSKSEMRGKKTKSWTCPFCQLDKLPQLIKPWVETADAQETYIEHMLNWPSMHFPWGVPETKVCLDGIVDKALGFQRLIYTFLENFCDPNTVPGRALYVHLLKKCCGLPFQLKTPSNVPAVVFLAEVLLANSGYDRNGLPAKEIPWKDIPRNDPRYAPQAQQAGTQDVKSEQYTPIISSAPLPPQTPERAHDRVLPAPKPSMGTSEGASVVDLTDDKVESPAGYAHSQHDDVRDSSFADDKKRKRGKRARFVFEEEVGIFVPVNGERVYCLCRRGETGTMISCDRCSLWFHNSCVHIGNEQELEERWICPMCCVKTERRYTHAEVKVKEMGVTDPHLWLDVRATLRSTRGPVSKLQHWTVDEDKRIALHLESYYPATLPSALDGEGKRQKSTDVDDAPNSNALGSVAIVPSWNDVRARVTPQHRTPYAEEQAAKIEREADERHRAGMANLYARGVTDAMIRKWYIGWNGKELVYPRHDRYGQFRELPLGPRIQLDPDDLDGSQLIQSLLDREREESRKAGIAVPDFADVPPPKPAIPNRSAISPPHVPASATDKPLTGRRETVVPSYSSTAKFAPETHSKASPVRSSIALQTPPNVPPALGRSLPPPTSRWSRDLSTLPGPPSSVRPFRVGQIAPFRSSTPGTSAQSVSREVPAPPPLPQLSSRTASSSLENQNSSVARQEMSRSTPPASSLPMLNSQIRNGRLGSPADAPLETRQISPHGNGTKPVQSDRHRGTLLTTTKSPNYHPMTSPGNHTNSYPSPPIRRASSPPLSAIRPLGLGIQSSASRSPALPAPPVPSSRNYSSSERPHLPSSSHSPHSSPLSKTEKEPASAYKGIHDTQSREKEMRLLARRMRPNA